MKRKIKYSNVDFVEGMLPKTRKEQFRDIFKHEWKTLLYIGILLFLFFVPELVLILFKNSYLLGLKNSVDQAKYDSFKLLPDLITNVAEILTLGIFVVGFSGSMRILRLLAWGEQFYFWSDFVKGIKVNFKKYFKIFLLIMFFVILNTLISYLINLIKITPLNTILVVLLDFIDIFLLLPIALYMFSYSNIYEDKMKKTVINSTAFSIKSYVFSVWFVLIPFGFFFIFNIGNILITILVILGVLVLIAPIALLAMYLLHLSYFDRLVNIHSFKEIYRKGLAKEE